MELIKSKQALTEEEVKTFEKKNGLTIPPDFIAFYLEHNGGRPSHRYYENYRIAFFIPMKYGLENNNIEFLMEQLNEAELLPNRFLPFANDSGGWYFCLDLNESNYGEVFVIRNGMGDEAPVFVAPNFKEFIDNLSIEENY